MNKLLKTKASKFTLLTALMYIDSTTVPTIIFHGTKDKVVPINQSKKLHKLLDKWGVKNEFIKVKKVIMVLILFRTNKLTRSLSRR
jgi:dipeptidyl aminopeptidase/acylaminoacyl peptidase